MSVLERDEPAIYLCETDENIELKDFYDEEDNVVYERFGGMDVVYDLDDHLVLTKHEDGSIYMSNLLYLRQHARPIYDRWFELK